MKADQNNLMIEEGSANNFGMKKSHNEQILCYNFQIDTDSIEEAEWMRIGKRNRNGYWTRHSVYLWSGRSNREHGEIATAGIGRRHCF